MTDFSDPALAIALDFPDRGRSVALDDKEQPAKFRIGKKLELRNRRTINSRETDFMAGTAPWME
jgi:hypothetical protein